VLESLRPFIVTYASARTIEDFPEDVRKLCAEAGHRKNINLGLMIVDANGFEAPMAASTLPFQKTRLTRLGAHGSCTSRLGDPSLENSL
jgi:hypothetical protein